MTKLIVDVSSVTRTNSPEDAVKLRAPEIRASKYTPGVVTTAWITVEAPEGPVDVEVEPGPIEVMIRSGQTTPDILRLQVPDKEQVNLGELLESQKPVDPTVAEEVRAELQAMQEKLNKLEQPPLTEEFEELKKTVETLAQAQDSEALSQIGKLAEQLNDLQGQLAQYAKSEAIDTMAESLQKVTALVTETQANIAGVSQDAASAAENANQAKQAAEAGKETLELLSLPTGEALERIFAMTEKYEEEEYHLEITYFLAAYAVIQMFEKNLDQFEKHFFLVDNEGNPLYDNSNKNPVEKVKQRVGYTPDKALKALVKEVNQSAEIMLQARNGLVIIQQHQVHGIRINRGRGLAKLAELIVGYAKFGDLPERTAAQAVIDYADIHGDAAWRVEFYTPDQHLLRAIPVESPGLTLLEETGALKAAGLEWATSYEEWVRRFHLG